MGAPTASRIVRVLGVVLAAGIGYGLGEGISSVLPLLGSGELTVGQALLVVGQTLGALGVASTGLALVVAIAVALALLEPRVRQGVGPALDALLGTPARVAGTVAGLALWMASGVAAALVVRRAEMTAPFLALLSAITATGMLALAAVPALAAGSALQRLLERAGRLAAYPLLLALAALADLGDVPVLPAPATGALQIVAHLPT